MQTKQPFSKQLHNWLISDSPKTVAQLEEVFGERSFAIIMLLLMALPALPIPTGGITHVLELICMLTGIELILGFKSFWLPKKWQHIELPKPLVKKALPLLIKKIEWIELRSNSKIGKKLLSKRWFLRVSGILMLGCTVSAFVAPPFSGLDTMPAMGVVGVSLGIIVGNMLIYVAGMVLGLLGIVLEITVGAAVFSAAKNFLLHSSTQTRIMVVILLTFLFLSFIHHVKSKKR